MTDQARRLKCLPRDRSDFSRQCALPRGCDVKTVASIAPVKLQNPRISQVVHGDPNFAVAYSIDGAHQAIQPCQSTVVMSFNANLGCLRSPPIEEVELAGGWRDGGREGVRALLALKIVHAVAVQGERRPYKYRCFLTAGSQGYGRYAEKSPSHLPTPTEPTLALPRRKLGVAFQVEVDVAELLADHGEAFEVVADVEFVGHAHAAVDLDGVLADELAGLADLDLGA